MMNNVKLIIAVVTLAASSFAVAGGPPDTVVGAGRVDSLGGKVEIMAKSDADGANATGRFSLRQGDWGIQGEVTCLSVSGNRAAASGTITASTDNSLVGTHFIQITRDNGEGWDNSDESQTGFSDTPWVCADWVDFDPAFDIDKGNYEIKDR
jgi:hypothetical protein